jgi:hypothetical protein
VTTPGNAAGGSEPLSVPVPWEGADDLRRRAAGRGLSPVLHLDPARGLARLEFPPGTDPAVVTAALWPEG